MESRKTFLMVGTYTDHSGSLGIYVYEMQKSDQGVKFVQTHTTRVTNPSFLAITNNKKYLLAVTEMDNECDSQVHSYSIQNDGCLSHIQSIHAEGTVSCFVTTDSHDKFAYVANYVGGTGASFVINSNGTLAKGAVSRFSGTSGVVPDRQDGPHIHASRLGIGDKYIYMTDLGNDRVVKLNFDPITGFNENSSEFYSTPPGSGPRHLAFHPNGKYLYVATELSNTVVVFKISELDGSLKQVQTISTLPADFKDVSFAAEILISTDSKILYVSNRGHDSLAIFSVSADGSALISLGHQTTKGKNPRNFNVVDDILVVANQDSDSIVPFKIAPDGRLLEMGKILSCPKPVCLKFLQY